MEGRKEPQQITFFEWSPPIDILSDISSDMLSDTYSDSLSYNLTYLIFLDILPGTLSDSLFGTYLASYLTCTRNTLHILTFHLAFWDSNKDLRVYVKAYFQSKSAALCGLKRTTLLPPVPCLPAAFGELCWIPESLWREELTSTHEDNTHMDDNR